MKKIFIVLLAVLLVLATTFAFAGCDASKTITVGASATPHAEILEIIKDKLAEDGWKLEIKVFDDYITPNTALDEGSLDANYFQHTPYLEQFNSDYNTDLVGVGKIHYEPFGLYGKNVTAEQYKKADFDKTGRTILIPNDGSNLTRALFVLQDEGFITLRSGASATETLSVQDIADSKGNKVNTIDAPTITAILQESDDGTLAVINGNYALQAGITDTVLALENAEGDAAQLYANIIAVKKGNEDTEKTRALLSALFSQEVYDYINATYGGSVLPVSTVE